MTGLCYLHSNPEQASELGRKSGRARRYVVPSPEPLTELAPPRTAGDVRDVIGKAMADVRERRMDPKIATTLAYCASVLLKSIELSNIEVRLAALETVLKTSRSTNTNGAYSET
jgi:hypothetical protein